jgi:cytochrome c biogenesis protein CcdA
MLGLALLVASIAVADSINPSTVVPALWLATASSTGRLASFTLGVLAVYLAGGLVVLFGPGRVIMSTLHHAHGPFEHVVEAAAGVAALVFAVFLWRSRTSREGQLSPRVCQTRASAFALGAGIMAIELPTAFIYFGAISAILAAHPAASLEVSLLTMYNALFVAPIVAIVVVRRLAQAPADRWIRSAEARVRSIGQVALAGVAGVAGAALLTIGLNGLFVL